MAFDLDSFMTSLTDSDNNTPAFSSQTQSFKALATIARAEENRAPQAITGKRAARSAKASGKGAARCAFGGKRSRTGPVWRASGAAGQAPANKISATSVSPSAADATPKRAE